MKKNLSTALIAGSLLAMALLQGCATKIKASTSQNPAPAESLNKFSRIEVKHAVFKPGYRGHVPALNKIDENIQKDLKEKLVQWNSGPANERTLVIEPVVEQVSFKSTTKRVFLGPLAGSSGVLMRMNIRDGKGNLIASPEFFQRAAAMGAGFTFGVHDNLMLTRVANLASAYVIANYEQAVGGPTGADDKNIAE
ncbi:hypothetical protein [Pseudoduganella violacea]|uniref:DUF4410 domain-containing protein n=1 Tax=Pseudoduganella violacea TaxID=1715466 RepID=A0A7W5FTP8_9BURK|nr:hypothetical protein [Pseudoduganella violacea]MBB3118897.1 hypothetical protein [Pseudoduganella violacea]